MYYATDLRTFQRVSYSEEGVTTGEPRIGHGPTDGTSSEIGQIGLASSKRSVKADSSSSATRGTAWTYAPYQVCVIVVEHILVDANRQGSGGERIIGYAVVVAVPGASISSVTSI